MPSKLVVVGDAFEAFAVLADVSTLAQYRQAKNHDGMRHSDILIGQGLAHDDVDALLVDGGESARLARGGVASLDLTHKQDRDHVLITTPYRIGPRCYGMEMVLNDKMDRLVDHVTGIHISGMVLIEAARQGVTATGEIEFDLTARGKPWGFVWTGCEVQFLSFAFPVPTNVVLTITDREDSTAERPKCRASVAFEQAGRRVCDVHIDYNVLPRRAIDSLELGAAKNVLCELLAAGTSIEPALA